MKIKAFNGIGSRPRQEDAYAIVEIPTTTDSLYSNSNSSDDNSNINPRTLIVVTDGMGGHEYGDEASRLVVKGMTDYWKGNPLQTDSPEKIRSAVQQTGIAYEQKTRGREMGSTLVMASIENDHAYIAHCGDSRIYIWHKDKHQFFHTNDHTRISEFGYELVANAFFTGNCNKIVPEIRYLEFHPGDRLMLCTDGVFKYIPGEDLRRIFTGDSDLSETAETLEDYCKAMSRDNYTAVLVEF